MTLNIAAVNKVIKSKGNFCRQSWQRYFEIFYVLAQVTRSLIISNKHGIYELPHELQNDLRLRILRIRKYQENIEPS